MPVRVKSKGAHVTVPATARAVKDLVAAGDGATEDPHGSPDICARRRGVGAARFSRLPCGPGAWSEEVSLSPLPRECSLRQPEIHAAGSQHPPFGCRRFELRRTQRRSLQDAAQQGCRCQAGVEVVLVRFSPGKVLKFDGK